MVLVGSKRSFQTGGAKAPSGQPALLHFSNFNGKKIPSGGAGSVINLTNDITNVGNTARVVTIDANTTRTAGIVNIGDGGVVPDAYFGLAAGTNAYLIMDSGTTSAAQINLFKGGFVNGQIVRTPVRMTTYGLILSTDNSNRIVTGAISSQALSGTQLLTLSPASGGTLNLSSVISNGSGTVALLKTDAGSLTLSGNSSYSGGSTIRAAGGVNGLAINHNNALGSGQVAVGDAFSGSETIILGTGDDRLIANNMVVSSLATGDIGLQHRDLSGPDSVAVYSGDIDLQRELIVRFFGSVADGITLSGDISGAGNLSMNTSSFGS